MGQRGQKLGSIPGFVPAMIGKQQGCSFAPRCPRALEKCWQCIPERTTINDTIDYLCHNPNPLPSTRERATESKKRAQVKDQSFIQVQAVEQVFTLRPNFMKPKKYLRASLVSIWRSGVAKFSPWLVNQGVARSTLAKVILGLNEPTSGKVLFERQTSGRTSQSQTRTTDSADFQDPFSSLNPRRDHRRNHPATIGGAGDWGEGMASSGSHQDDGIGRLA